MWMMTVLAIRAKGCFSLPDLVRILQTANLKQKEDAFSPAWGGGVMSCYDQTTDLTCLQKWPQENYKDVETTEWKEEHGLKQENGI